MSAQRTPWTSNRVVGSPYPPAPYAIERVFPTVRFDRPVDLTFMPGSTRLFVAEEKGRIWSFETRDGTDQAALALDVREHHRPFDNVLGFTFHPGFATNRFIFINYNEPGGRTNGAYVSRFTVLTTTPPTIDPASEKIILRWLSGGHNGCTLAFGNDGMLYISTGDADDPDPPDGKRKTGQDIGDLLGSILRIDVDGAMGTNGYAVPRDNPFLNTLGARPEIWAFGFRNPFRTSFDRETGDLWVGDVGWEQWEMVYRVQRGGNYGWAITEGPNASVRTDVKSGPGPILPPMAAISHTDGASITGGFVYRGQRLPKLRGAYVYGDWETGRFWALRHDGDKLLSNEELCDTALKPAAFALDPEGELLVLDYNGGLYRFVPNTAAPANESFPRKLSDTGLFASLSSLTPAPGVLPYRINAPMWNDHAAAEWLLAVPGTNTIATEGGVGNIAGATWYFPSNTVLARTLTLEMKSGEPASRRRIETQLLHWDGQGWNPYTYRWNAAQTDAELAAAGTNDVFTVVDAGAPGGRRETPWRFMSRSECLRCHNAWAGEALTLNWMQLGGANAPSPPTGERERARAVNDASTTAGTSAAANADSLAPLGVRGQSEWSRLVQLGLLRDRNKSNRGPALSDPHHDSLPIADRARSWLHVNCGTCHRFGAGGTALIHLNFDKPAKEMRAIGEKPVRGDFGIAGARIIAPGDPFASTLMWRISTEGAGHMPIVGSRLVDDTGVGLVRNWIRSLESNSNRWNTASPLLPEDPPTLLGSMNGALQLADALTRPGEVAARPRAEIIDAAAAHTNAFVRDLFQRFLPPEQRRRTLGTEIDPQTILSRKGDTARGRELFLGASQCSRCHVAEGEGRAFGPDLGAAAKKYPRAQLLEQILFPSRTIAPEFKTTVVTLNDDTELSGFVLRRTGGEIVLRDESLIEHRLPPARVKESHESTLSAMPEGLLAPLTAQEAADLLEFLAGLAGPSARSGR